MLINYTNEYLTSIVMFLCLMHLIEGQKNETRQKFRVKKFKIDFNSRFRNTLFNKYEEIELPKEDDDEEEGKADEPQKLENIDMILQGYDIFIGDPNHEKDDPGLRLAKIFQIDKEDQTVSGDGRWYVPKYIDFNVLPSGAMTTQSKEVTGEQSFQDSIGFSIDHQGSMDLKEVTAAFSASFHFQTASNETNINKKIMYTSSMVVTRYTMENSEGLIGRYDQMDPGFKKDFEQVPSVASKGASAIMKFIVTKYGTHFVKRAVMGACAFRMTSISRESYIKLKQMGIDASVGASLSVGDLFNVSNKISGGYNSTELKMYRDESTEEWQWFKGVPKPTDGDFSTWVKEAQKVPPYPIQMTIIPITELFNTFNFPNITEEDLNAKKLLLESFMVGEYCKVILAKDGCKDALADNIMPTVPKIQPTTAAPPKERVPLLFSGPYGDLYKEEYCQNNSYIYGFRTKGFKEYIADSLDDLGLSGAEFMCSSSLERLLTPVYKDDPGDYGEIVTCDDGFVGASEMIYPGGHYDDSGMGGLQMECSNGTILESKRMVGGGDWGTFTEMRRCPPGKKITGMQAQFQVPQGNGDDSALNAIIFFCV